MAIPLEVIAERLRSREAAPLTTGTFLCSQLFQDFLALVLPDLQSSTGRTKDPAKEEQIRQAAAKAIKEIRSYGFELRTAEAIEKTSQRDIEDYGNQQDGIEVSIKGVQEEIGKLKEGLVVERKKRLNKEVYEEVCKDINTCTPHRETKLAIEKLERDLAALDEERKTVQGVQRLKHKQVALLMQTLADVQAAVDEGDKEEGPTTGALEPVHPDSEVVVDGAAATVGEVDGEGEGEDDEGNGAEDDGEVEQEERRRRSRRKRSPSADSDEGAVAADSSALPPIPGSCGGGAGKGPHEADDADMPDVAS